MRAVLVGFIVLSVTLAGCVERHTFERCRGGAADWADGTICVDGRLRSFIAAVPEGEGPFPLLVALHGGAGDAANMQGKTRLDDLAREHGIVVIYPEGTPKWKGSSIKTWNAAHCCGQARSDGTDDVAFLDALIESAADNVFIDGDRIGVTGHSNGGMMAHFYGAHRAGTISHIMPVAGAIGGRTPPEGPLQLPPTPSAALDVLIIHAIDDPRVPFAGGQGENLGEQRDDTGVADAVAFWEGVGSDVQVVQARGGHGWPGGKADLVPAPREPDASQLIVAHLTQAG